MHVRKTDTCWLWTGCASWKGYGLFYSEDGCVTAHRYSFKLAHGRVPKKFALHHCDVKLCVRPDHLYDGGRVENAHDLFLRGKPKTQKLSPDDVRRIRERFREGASTSDLARDYGVGITAIAQLKRGETYGWLH